MAPELIVAADAQRYGWNRTEIRVRLCNSDLTEAEIDRLLEIILNDRSGKRLEGENQRCNKAQPHR